jgi:uncharacterized protein (UPF0333 family)
MKHTNKKEGMALVYVVLVMGLLVTMGTSMLFMAEHNNTESNVEVTNEQSYLTAQSGLYAAMDLINQHPDQLTAAAAQLTGTNGVAINPYAEGSQSNLGDLKITMSCDNNTNPCTLVKISSTGTYDGTSRTVSGYFKRKRVVNITDMSPYTYTDENTKNSNDIDNGLVNIADASGDFYDSGDWELVLPQAERVLGQRYRCIHGGIP